MYPKSRYFIKGMSEMKKLSKLTLTLLCTALLAGCSSESKQAKDTSSKTQTSKVAEKSSSSQAKSSETSQATQASSSSQSSSSEASSSESAQSQTSGDDKGANLTNNERVQYAAGAMRQKLGDSALVVTLSGQEDTNKKVNIFFEGDINNYTANYYLAKEAKNINEDGVKDGALYATLTKKTYANVDEAKDQIEYTTDASQGSLPKINLGYNIQATVNSGAGQRYLHWNEGNWSLTMHGSPVAGENPTVAAQKAVALLERYRLPAPTQRGNARFETTDKNDYLGQTLTWNKDNVVYEFKANNLERLIVMASSLQ